MTTEPSRQQHWTDVYSRKGETEVSWFQPHPQVSLDLVARSAVGRDAALIDIGGGASRLADALLAAGYSDVSVLDIAEPALRQARQRLGTQADRVRWIVADITQWQPGRQYALWHDRAVFHFLTDAADRAAYRSALMAALPSGGQAIIASFAPDGPERCSGLPVQRYSPDTLQGELGPDFLLQETQSELHRTPGGAVQSFQFSRFRRR